MIKEKMLELLVLQNIINNNRNIFYNKTIEFNGMKYNFKAIKDRYKELTSEFLEPYVI